MAFNSPRQIDINAAHQDFPGSVYHGQKGIQVQIPRMPMTQMQSANFSREDSAGGAVYGRKPVYPQDPNDRQLPHQSQTAVRQNTSVSAVTDKYSSSVAHTSLSKRQHAPIDHLLLLSLAEEYFAAAHGDGSVVALLQRGQHLDCYYKLIATGLGCLETVLKSWRLQPKLEATTRLRYASILYQETENFMEAEEVLSQGILLCERHRFFNLKYNMQYLLARVMFATNSKASLKFLDGVIKDLEAYAHVAWIYAFRFLRASLSLQMASYQEFLIALTNLKLVTTCANGRGDNAISAAASITLALAYLHQSNNAESIEQAQRALAAARSSQLDRAAQTVPQVTTLAYFVDLCCSLQQNDPTQATPKMHAMQKTLDLLIKDKGWTNDGSCSIPISHQTAATLQDSDLAAGIVRTDSDQSSTLLISWLPREDIYALAYLLSGAVNVHRNAMDGQKSELYLKEASRIIEAAPTRTNGPLCALASQHLWRQTLLCQVQLQLAFALCTRTSWAAAKDQLSQLKTTLGTISSPPNSLCLFTTYLSGVIAQGTGDLSTALSIFQSSPLALPTSPSSKTALDLAILSALNTLFIIRSPSHPSHHLLTPLLATLDPLCLSNPSKNLHAAYHLARATAHPHDPTGIVKTKQYLQSALQAAKQTANNQLMCITLNFMSWKFFRGVVAEQAEKSARASQTLARKGKDPLWISVAEGRLADTLEVMGKGAEAEQVRREGWEAAGKLPMGIQQREGEDGLGVAAGK